MQHSNCLFSEERIKDDKSFSKKNLQKLLTSHSLPQGHMSLYLGVPFMKTRSFPCFI